MAARVSVALLGGGGGATVFVATVALQRRAEAGGRVRMGIVAKPGATVARFFRSIAEAVIRRARVPTRAPPCGTAGAGGRRGRGGRWVTGPAAVFGKTTRSRPRDALLPSR